MNERLWRCVECGKWSHAKRDPRKHKRFAGIEPNLPDDASIAETAEGREEETGAPVTVVWLWCGPFEEWKAERIA